MSRVALFPGSFDPITKGHEDILLRALPLFDQIYIAIGINSDKKSYFPIEQRIEWIRQCIDSYPTVRIETYKGLTVDFCNSVGAHYIIRGIRNEADFRYEKDISQINKELAPAIETVFFATSPILAHISSSLLRDICINNGNYRQFMPDKIT